MANDDERCDCCELLLASCGKSAENRARAEAAARKAKLLSTPGVFAAAWPGTCDGCGEHFPAGTPIVRDTSATDGGWIAGCCL